jgi:hypothetical protein
MTTNGDVAYFWINIPRISTNTYTLVVVQMVAPQEDHHVRESSCIDDGGCSYIDFGRSPINQVVSGM